MTEVFDPAKPLTIVGAAIRVGERVTWLAPTADNPAPRWGHVILSTICAGPGDPIPGDPERGFMTSHGDYVDRSEAAIIYSLSVGECVHSGLLCPAQVWKAPKSITKGE